MSAYSPNFTVVVVYTITRILILKYLIHWTKIIGESCLPSSQTTFGPEIWVSLINGLEYELEWWNGLWNGLWNGQCLI